jgi:hypothetical protein
MHQPPFKHVVCLYVAEGFEREGDRGLLGDSAADVVRVAEQWLGMAPGAATAPRPVRRRRVRRPRIPRL